VPTPLNTLETSALSVWFVSVSLRIVVSFNILRFRTDGILSVRVSLPPRYALSFISVSIKGSIFALRYVAPYPSGSHMCRSVL